MIARNLVILIIAFAVSSCSPAPKVLVNSRVDISGYRYIHIKPIEYLEGKIDKYGLEKKVKELFLNRGLIVLDGDAEKNLDDNLRGQLLYCRLKHHPVEASGFTSATVSLELFNVLRQKLYHSVAESGSHTFASNLRNAANKAFNAFSRGYMGFNPSSSLDLKEGIKKAFSDWERINVTEDQVRSYLNRNLDALDIIEGIWTELASNSYRIAIVKDAKNPHRDFVGIVMASETLYWAPKQVMIEFIKTAYPGIYTTSYYTNNRSKLGVTATIDENGFLNLLVAGDDKDSIPRQLIKNYPEYPRFWASAPAISKDAPKASRSGTGFLISNEGYIATNWHVIKNSNDITAYFPASDRSYSAKVRIKDTKNDLAILQLQQFYPSNIAKKTIPFRILPSQFAKLGEDIFAIGFPIGNTLGKSIKVSRGHIASLDGMEGDPTHFQISAPIQPGNSGSPVFNRYGDLIGIVVESLNTKYFQDEMGFVPQNVNFAIKSDYLLNLLSMLSGSHESQHYGAPSKTVASLEEIIERIKPYIAYIEAK